MSRKMFANFVIVTSFLALFPEIAISGEGGCVNVSEKVLISSPNYAEPIENEEFPIDFVTKISGTLRGVVFDATTGKPLPDVFVLVSWGAAGPNTIDVFHQDVVRSDAKGAYDMDNWSDFPWGMVDRHISYGAYKFGYKLVSVKDQQLHMRPLIAGECPLLANPRIKLSDWSKKRAQTVPQEEPKSVAFHFHRLYLAMSHDFSRADASEEEHEFALLAGAKAQSALCNYAKPFHRTDDDVFVNDNLDDSLQEGGKSH